MVSLLKVGHVVSGVVTQTRPDYGAYLVFLAGTQIFAFLPHEYAKDRYRVGSNVVAVIFSLDRNRIILNQVSSPYYRRIADVIFGPLIETGKIKIKRVAHIKGVPFVKIAIKNLAIEEERFPEECLPYLSRSKHYVNETLNIVRFRKDMHEYIKEALAPAPKDKIWKVIYAGSTREARVTVDPAYYGKFVGKGGANVACAAKLLDIRIDLKKGEK